MSCVIQVGMPVVKGTTIISNEVVAVRGMAKQGPMVRMMASASTMANLGETRSARYSNPPAEDTASTPSTGRPTAEMMNPTAASGVADPACAPRNGGKIRFAAPKNMEKKVNVIRTRLRTSRRSRVVLAANGSSLSSLMDTTVVPPRPNSGIVRRALHRGAPDDVVTDSVCRQRNERRPAVSRRMPSSTRSRCVAALMRTKYRPLPPNWAPGESMSRCSASR